MIRFPKYNFIIAIRKNLFIYIAILVLLFFMAVVDAFSSTNLYHVVINVKTDRPDAIYQCGEQATFLIDLMEAGQPLKTGEVSVSLTLDGMKEIKEEIITINNKPISITGTLNEPGFLRCTVKYSKGKEDHYGYAAAGFEPERIKTMTIMPEDFDEFWAEGQKELAAIPLDLRLTPLPEYSDDGHKCYKISFANVDNTRIYGFLNEPTKKSDWVHEPRLPGNPLILKKKLYPAQVIVPSAGIGKPREPIVSNHMLTLHIGVHDHELGLPQEKYDELKNGRLKDHYFWGAPDRKRYYCRRAILGVDRAITYIASHPNFNSKKLVISGSSQGGFFALMMAGLNQYVTAAAAIVPGFCDQGGYLAGRRPGSPQLVLKAPEKEQDLWLKMSSYFDTVNFARKIKCPVIVFVGFIDHVCPPGSIYAAYNEIKAPKHIINMPLTGHGFADQFGSFKDKWINGQLGLGDPVPPIKE